MPHDGYLTPPIVAEAAISKLITTFPHFNPGTVLEPGCGMCVHLDYAAQEYDSIIFSLGVDIDAPEFFDPFHEVVKADFLTYPPPLKFELIITNPPFTYAEKFIRRAATMLAPGGIAMFLTRYAIATGKNRTAKLWKEINLRYIWMLDRRPSFAFGGNDSCEYAYILFDNGLPGKPQMDWLTWKTEKEKRQCKNS